MTRTLAAKVAEGIRSQRWTLSGYGGTWAGAMRPLEEYVKRKVEKAVAAERDACAALLEANGMRCGEESLSRLILETNASAIRARNNT
jgi:hypothetical protein